jgi:hypothetical protein
MGGRLSECSPRAAKGQPIKEFFHRDRHNGEDKTLSLGG